MLPASGFAGVAGPFEGCGFGGDLSSDGLLLGSRRNQHHLGQTIAGIELLLAHTGRRARLLGHRVGLGTHDHAALTHQQ